MRRQPLVFEKNKTMGLDLDDEILMALGESSSSHKKPTRKYFQASPPRPSKSQDWDDDEEEEGQASEDGLDEDMANDPEWQEVHTWNRHDLMGDAADRKRYPSCSDLQSHGHE